MFTAALARGRCRRVDICQGYRRGREACVRERTTVTIECVLQIQCHVCSTAKIRNVFHLQKCRLMVDNGRLPGNHSARIQKKNIDFPPEVDTRRFVRMRVVCYQLIDQSINQAMHLF